MPTSGQEDLLQHCSSTPFEVKAVLYEPDINQMVAAINEQQQGAAVLLVGEMEAVGNNSSITSASHATSAAGLSGGKIDLATAIA